MKKKHFLETTQVFFAFLSLSLFSALIIALELMFSIFIVVAVFFLLILNVLSWFEVLGCLIVCAQVSGQFYFVFFSFYNSY